MRGPKKEWELTVQAIENLVDVIGSLAIIGRQIVIPVAKFAELQGSIHRLREHIEDCERD